jgi:hypothetical protein
LLSPYADQGRFVGWSSHANEENLFERMGISGELPELNGGDGLAVVINNVGNNKIDYYLTGEVAYTVDTDQGSGTATGTLNITLHNGAPPGVTEPSTVFGNTAGAPPGTSVMELNVYSAMPVSSMTVNAVDRPADRVDEHLDFHVTTLSLQIPGQSTTEITVQLAGPLDLSDGYRLSVRTGASVNPFDTSLIVDEAIVEDLGARAGTVRLGADGD